MRHHIEVYDNDKNLRDYMGALTKAANSGALFDARAFILPKEEVCNYFIWRQQDAIRNSILSVAQSQYPHKELYGKKCDMLKSMILEEKGIDWNTFNNSEKQGTCIIKEPISDDGYTMWFPDNHTPIFTQNREYIDKYI